MANDDPPLRLYDALAGWWPLLSPPSEYDDEAADLISRLAPDARDSRRRASPTHPPLRPMMRLQDFYPIVVTEHLRACRDFYQRWFGFEVVFEASWFVLLGASDGHRASLAFMHPSHPSAPPGPESFSGKGMCLEFQVADAAAEYRRLQAEGAPLELPLRDEPFGQRRFGLFDPAGTWIDVVEQIAPLPGWWDRYLPAAAETDHLA